MDNSLVKKTDNWDEVPLIAEDVSDVNVRNGIEMIHLKMDNIPDYYYLHCYYYDYCYDDYEVLDYRFGIRYNWDK